MNSLLRCFNIYFIAAIFLLGCKTTEPKLSKKEKEAKKQATALRFHLEVNSDGSPGNAPITVFRENPFRINIRTQPYLTEGDIAEAALVETVGGFGIRVQFDHHGTLLLDNLSTSSRGQRLAIFCAFGEQRWLAAPVLTRRISTGEFIFTPDATKEESERIVLGLNNLVRELKKSSTLDLISK